MELQTVWVVLQVVIVLVDFRRQEVLSMIKDADERAVLHGYLIPHDLLPLEEVGVHSMSEHDQTSGFDLLRDQLSLLPHGTLVVVGS